MADGTPVYKSLRGSLPDKGACWNCGFLARETPDNASAEVDLLGRRLGLVSRDDPDSADETVVDASELPSLSAHCYRSHVSLFDEVIDQVMAEDETADKDDPQKYSSAMLAVINTDRNCPKWYPHHPGRSPEAHYQEVRTLDLERHSEAFEQRMEEGRRQFDEGLDRSNKEFLAGLENQRQEWEKDSGRWPSRLIWAAIILALAEVAGTFLGLPVVTRLLGLD